MTPVKSKGIDSGERWELLETDAYVFEDLYFDGVGKMGMVLNLVDGPET